MNSLTMDSGSESSSDSRLRSQPSEFVIQKEDFPALSTFASISNDKSPLSSEPESKRHSSFTSSAADGMVPQVSGLQLGSTSIGSHAGGVAPGFNGSVNASNVSGGGAFGQLHSSAQAEDTNGSELDSNSQYGLLGMLMTVIRPSSDSKKNLAMGCDLTSLGLNLNSSEYVLLCVGGPYLLDYGRANSCVCFRPLHPTFASPWAEGPATKEPQFTLPTCYYNQPPVLKTTHLSKFHLETLFFIFYSMPKDVLQAYAAQELYSREWRYHTELKTWLKRASPADAALLASSASNAATLSGSAPGSSPVGGGAGSSAGASVGSIGSASGGAASAGALGSGALGPQFLYFDATTWERRVFTGNIHSVSTGLMSEEEIRVKFTAPS